MKDPAAFQGESRRRYFEGWYFKNVAPDGTAFSFIPGAWVWIHGNGFPDPNDSVMISIVRIPWISRTFTGFLGLRRRR